jgi:P5-type ATPase cation transporter
LFRLCCILFYFCCFFLSCFSNQLLDAHTTRTRFQSTCFLGSTPNNYRSISSLPSQDANLRRSLHEGILNKDQEDEMFVYGYKKSTFRTFVCYTCVVLTLGILRLVMHWWSHWLLLATHKKCSLEDAEKVLVKEKFQGKHAIYYVKLVTTLTSESIR